MPPKKEMEGVRRERGRERGILWKEVHGEGEGLITGRKCETSDRGQGWRNSTAATLTL